ncbi:hypothetical protein [Spirosoma sp.]|uniref:hypothetical protein n=1 Tax=Spirosoma sp. TaxID=1899569 RepID=UPI00260F4F2F|nr:hypothetical protein [Spirosoma sp.]MCX6216805.1 hypothetical protein [Spirosoma sp.]
MITYEILRKSVVRQLVDQFVEFHPDMTEQQREESIPACLDVITLFMSLTVTFLGVLAWAII